MTSKHWLMQQATVYLVVPGLWVLAPTPALHSSSPSAPPTVALLTAYLQGPPAVSRLCICSPSGLEVPCGQASPPCRFIASIIPEHGSWVDRVRAAEISMLCGFPTAARGGTLLNVSWRKKGRICGGGSGVFPRNMQSSSTTRFLLTGLPIPGGNPGAGACREKPALPSFPRRWRGHLSGIS